MSVAFSVSDPEAHPYSVFVSTTPTSTGTFNSDGSVYTYTFTVSNDMFLSSSLTPLEFTAVDSLGATTTASVPVFIAFTPCSGLMSQVQLEASTELNYFCLGTATSCSAGCKSVLVRLTGLSCYSTLVSEIGSPLSDAQKLCCDGASVPCSVASTSPPHVLSAGDIAGIAVGLCALLLLLTFGMCFVIRRKRRELKEQRKGKEAGETREYQLEPVRDGARGRREKGSKEGNEIHETFF